MTADSTLTYSLPAVSHEKVTAAFDGSRLSSDACCEWAYLFGMICTGRRTGAAIVMPYANTEARNLHLEEIQTPLAQRPRRARPRWSRLAWQRGTYRQSDDDEGGIAAQFQA